MHTRDEAASAATRPHPEIPATVAQRIVVLKRLATGSAQTDEARQLCLKLAVAIGPTRREVVIIDPRRPFRAGLLADAV